MNWPVSKKIGGQEAVVPKEVIGAHGGFAFRVAEVSGIAG